MAVVWVGVVEVRVRVAVGSFESRVKREVALTISMEKRVAEGLEKVRVEVGEVGSVEWMEERTLEVEVSNWRSREGVVKENFVWFLDAEIWMMPMMRR